MYSTVVNYILLEKVRRADDLEVYLLGHNSKSVLKTVYRFRENAGRLRDEEACLN